MEGILETEAKSIKTEEETILEQQSSPLDALQNKDEISVADQSQIELFEDDPVSSALSNSLIMDKILMELDYDYLLSSRLVSQSWEEMVLSVFSKTSFTKYHLPLNKLFKSPEYNSMPMSKFMTNLVKCIHFSQECTCGNNCTLGGPACETTITKFIEFINNFSNHIEIMDCYISASFLSILRTLSNNCPNLKVLYFKTEARFLAPRERVISYLETPVPEEPFYRMDLHTIEVFHDVYSSASNFRWLLQHVINGALNLKRLKIWDNFYPDLSNNTRLVFLSHTSRADMYNFNRTTLCEMLDQVKDFLEVLELSTTGSESSNVQQQQFAFPVMSMLKTLTLNIAMYSFGQDGLDAVELLFPNLENLELSSSGTDTVVDMLSRTTLFQHVNLRTLMLDKIENPAVLSFFKLWFPNLRKLELSLCLAIDEISDESSIESLFLAMSMGSLELKHFILRIDSKFRFLLSTLVRQLDANPELFEEMEILEIYTKETFEWSLAKDDLGSTFENRGGDKYESMKKVFCDWLENKAKNMKSVLFHGFTFSGKTAWEVMSLIREKKIPVKFVNAEY